MSDKEESEVSSERKKSSKVRHRDQDGGWAWVVLVFTCVLQTMGGLVYTTGLFNIMFLEEFGESRQTTAWIGSIQSASKCLYGPLSALILDRLGGRFTVIIGTLIGFLGFLLAAFAKNFVWLLCTFGILLGLGNGISYIAWVMAIGVYFDKYRNLAYGIASACTGLGTIMLSPLIQYLFSQFGWRGCILIMSAIYLHNIAVGIVYVPRKTFSEEDCNNEVEIEVKSGSEREPEGYKLEENKLDTSSTHPITIIGSGSTYQIRKVEEDCKIVVEVKVKCESECELKGCKLEESKWSTASTQSLTSIEASASSQTQEVKIIRPRSNSLPERHSRSMTHDGVTVRSHWAPLIKRIQKQNIHGEFESRGEFDTKLRQNAFHHVEKDSEDAIGQYSTKHGSNTSLNKAQPISNTNPTLGAVYTPGPRSTVCTNASYSPELKRPDHLRYDNYKGSVRNQSDLHLVLELNEAVHSVKTQESQTSKLCRVVKNRRLWVIAFNSICTSASGLLVVLHFPDLFRSKGSSASQLAIVLSCIGATSMLCRVLVGLASSSKDIGVLLLYLGSGIISGAFIFLTPVLAKTFTGQMTFVVFQGFYGNAYISLMPALTLEVSGPENFSFAYGLVLLMCGVSGAVGPPIGGWLYDITGNYDTTFYFAGALCTVGSLSLLLIPVLSPSQPKENTKQNTTEC